MQLTLDSLIIRAWNDKAYSSSDFTFHKRSVNPL